ncbi:mechanosensitive ion channel family protein [Actomonas aquatica]|uniref:Mechanosensitive ion channel family protein n=1 Tax=Actomonas aquatica TaxID=2866162 RepID=A0ABZ1CE05_9BACT|nr:mechanosensitive ion channel family protein [Opitutus sp. WL0086]WRQ89909.1 mechanosensitive ion channel family protein [Opitutus sp. WL0086]
MASPDSQPSTEAVAAAAQATNIEPITLDRTFSILQEKLVSWFDTGVALLPNFLIAALIVVVTYAIGSVVGRVTNRVFNRAFDSGAVASLFATISRVVVIALGFFAALEMVGLQKAVVSLLAGAGIIGLALGFAFQDLAENLLAGLLMGIRKPFKPGNLIQSNDQFGFIEKLNLRNTIIRNFSGQIIYIPNKEVFKNVLINYSKSGERRIEIAVGVSYGEDLKKVTDILHEAIEGLDFRKADKDIDIFALEFGDSSINFTVRYWIDYPDGDTGYFNAIDAGIKAIKTAFDEHDILIPFPIRTLDFNARGGDTLSDHLQPIAANPEEGDEDEGETADSQPENAAASSR